MLFCDPMALSTCFVHIIFPINRTNYEYLELTNSIVVNALLELRPVVVTASHIVGDIGGFQSDYIELTAIDNLPGRYSSEDYARWQLDICLIVWCNVINATKMGDA